MKQTINQERELAVRMVVVMEKLVTKLETEGKNLDEYQRAQIVQALVLAKRKLMVQLNKLTEEDLTSLRGRLEMIEEQINDLAAEIDIEKVADILTTLKAGMVKLLEKTQEKD